jgi:hypothetical protein
MCNSMQYVRVRTTTDVRGIGVTHDMTDQFYRLGLSSVRPPPALLTSKLQTKYNQEAPLYLVYLCVVCIERDTQFLLSCFILPDT